MYRLSKVGRPWNPVLLGLVWILEGSEVLGLHHMGNAICPPAWVLQILNQSMRQSVGTSNACDDRIGSPPQSFQPHQELESNQ